MTAGSKTSAPARASLAEVRKPLRELGKQVRKISTSGILKKAQEEAITDEFAKLAPKLRRFGFQVVINGRKVDISAIPSRRTIFGPAVKAVSNKNQETAKSDSMQSAGLRLVEEMKQAHGGSLTGSELQADFNLNPATLHRRRKEHRILFWRDSRHAFHYPKWQFTETGALLNGVQEVLKIFKSTDEWRVMRYFLAPRHQLQDKAPLEWLREGHSDIVIEHAKLHEAENSW